MGGSLDRDGLLPSSSPVAAAHSRRSAPSHNSLNDYDDHLTDGRLKWLRSEKVKEVKQRRQLHLEIYKGRLESLRNLHVEVPGHFIGAKETVKDMLAQEEIALKVVERSRGPLKE